MRGSSRERGRVLKNCTHQTVFNSLHLEREQEKGQMAGESKTQKRGEGMKKEELKGLGDCF